MWLVAVGIVVAAIASLIAAARSEAGTRWLLGHVPGLSTEGVRGSLWGDALAIDSLRWEGLATQPSLQVE